jgi:hypothetical protein
MQQAAREPVLGEPVDELAPEHVVADSRGQLDRQAEPGGGAGEDDRSSAWEGTVERQRLLARVAHERGDRLTDDQHSGWLGPIQHSQPTVLRSGGII